MFDLPGMDTVTEVVVTRKAVGPARQAAALDPPTDGKKKEKETARR